MFQSVSSGLDGRRRSYTLLIPFAAVSQQGCKVSIATFFPAGGLRLIHPLDVLKPGRGAPGPVLTASLSLSLGYRGDPLLTGDRGWSKNLRY